MQKIIEIRDGIVRMPEWRMAQPVNFEACEGEHIAIVGPNGGGKTMLVNILTGSHPLLMKGPTYDFAPSTKPMVADNIKYIAFRDSYGASDGTYYLQQRWNQQEIDKETPTTYQLLEKAFLLSGGDTPERRQWQKHLYELFDIEHTLNKYIIFLSSGELRKYQIIKSLLTEPRVLIMDNPFIGLDAETRDLLKTLLKKLTDERTLQIFLVLAKSDDIPDFITHVVEVKNKTVGRKQSREEYIKTFNHRIATHKTSPLTEAKRKAILTLPLHHNDYTSEQVVGMERVSIRYGERTILKDLDWIVGKGEHWAVYGQNGSGKSTLLSLVCADNPQAYACNITLFGHQRGSGESIWDIKKHIGYVSPEMHRAYQKNLPAIRIVASGLKDSVGLYTKPNVAEYDICRYWMNIFGLDGKEDRPFLKLSSGEQRLVLLARAFVKDPQLLILDEPLHGLDNHNRQLVKDIIETFCQRKNKTLIIVTHYKEELPQCIDHHITLNRNL